MASHVPFFSPDPCEPMAFWLGQDTVSRVTLKLCADPRPFCMALSPSGDWHTRFYIAVLSGSMIFSFSNFVGSDLALTLPDKDLTSNINIRLRLFRGTWSRARPARGPDLATCAGLGHGK